MISFKTAIIESSTVESLNSIVSLFIKGTDAIVVFGSNESCWSQYIFLLVLPSLIINDSLSNVTEIQTFALFALIRIFVN